MHELNGGSVSIWMFDNRGFCIRVGLIGDRGFVKMLRGFVLVFRSVFYFLTLEVSSLQANRAWTFVHL